MSKFVSITEALAVPRCKQLNKPRLAIYALYDPRDGGIRYIGVTNKKLAQRLARHWQQPTNPAMRGWFQELHRSGRGPRIELLEYVRHHEWEDAERGWIHWARQRGTLLNVDRGGMARDKAGNTRAFVAGAYQPPVSGKNSQEAQKGPVAVRRAGTSAEGRPRLVPVARGVFRRSHPRSPQAPRVL